MTVVVIIGWLVYVSVNIVAPRQGDLDSPRDVVVSLAPQESRLPMAQQLIAEGIADTLVISYFAHDPMNHIAAPTDGMVPLSNYCEPSEEPDILCFTPEEDSTLGEALAISDLVKDNSWDSLTVVTDPFHAFRTRYIYDQCLDGDVEINIVFSERDLNISEWAWHVVYENAAFLKAAWETTTRC
ncbi:hypothetical protein GCM10022249_23430 [Enteractinococcus coprophilus]